MEPTIYHEAWVPKWDPRLLNAVARADIDIDYDRCEVTPDGVHHIYVIGSPTRRWAIGEDETGEGWSLAGWDDHPEPVIDDWALSLDELLTRHCS